ncbi:hypothetical protein K466DRAFT_304086 [Polyporus arcularius HHB13444]|uniref:Uncharacterized protein n=1 Tax=Polyporus arcularius HHB13444 TaxID=1314778 RepID=A0A5C3NY68_9APHY|nr:hypothetical protein K466DRAFT_304086 [Polyporus arcularius HHB13444]
MPPPFALRRAEGLQSWSTATLATSSAVRTADRADLSSCDLVATGKTIASRRHGCACWVLSISGINPTNRIYEYVWSATFTPSTRTSHQLLILSQLPKSSLHRSLR